MRIIFAGTPEIALTPLKALLDFGHHVVAVYTQPDQPAGRGRILTASPVKQFALEHHIPIEQPINFKCDDAISRLKEYDADLMMVMAYGIILPKRVLDIPRLGCMNIHVSLLPRWRGAAPVQHAILAGDQETGVTLMQMDVGLDTGNILKQIQCPILESDTSESLYARLETLIPPLLHELSGLNAVPQDSAMATYASKINKIDAKIEWSETAEMIVRKIHAYNPSPVAFAGDIRLWQAHVVSQQTNKAPGTILSADKKGIVVQAGKDAVCIAELQMPGKKRLAAHEILNAYQQRFSSGDLFS